jgi:hypothetical protein
MKSRRAIFHIGIPVIGCALLGGCMNGERHGSTPDRRPAMPTVALASGNSANRVAESEIIASALRAARAGNPDEVLRALRSVADRESRARLSGELMTTLIAEDPREAARLALVLDAELDQTALLEYAGRSLARRDPEFALQWSAERPPTPATRRLWQVVVDELVAANPRGAIDRIKAQPAGPVRDDLLVLAAAAWARRDPEAAISWLREFPDDALRRRLTSSVGFEVAQKRPQRAVEVAEMLPAGRDRWLLFSAIAQTWVAVDSKAALAWAGRLPAGEPRDAAFAGIDTGFGVPIARRIAGAPGTRSGSSRTRGGVAAAVAWPEINSPAFAAWLATQPPGLSREEAILEYVRQRAALEPGAIGPLISALSPGRIRDEAMRIYLEGLLTGSPTEAARWVSALPRSERSDELIEKTARRWLLTNPDAAAEWLEQSTLPQYRKEQLLRDAGR